MVDTIGDGIDKAMDLIFAFADDDGEDLISEIKSEEYKMNKIGIITIKASEADQIRYFISELIFLAMRKMIPTETENNIPGQKPFMINFRAL